MKFFKLLVFLLLMIILTYVPTFSLANDDISNEKIINQLQTYGEVIF